MPKSTKTENELMVLGTIHEGHLKHSQYSMAELWTIIERINPDLILGEIPPDRYTAINEAFITHGTITDSRMKDLPEYEAVIFPLARQLGIDIVPVSAWTSKMARSRYNKIQSIVQDPSRQKQWSVYQKAHTTVSHLLQYSGKGYDPLWIDSDEYDELLKIELDAFSTVFNDELGEGGLENINRAHYQHIDKALNNHAGLGIRILLMFGAGHKGWFREKLKQRTDIRLLTLNDLW